MLKAPKNIKQHKKSKKKVAGSRRFFLLKSYKKWAPADISTWPNLLQPGSWRGLLLHNTIGTVKNRAKENPFLSSEGVRAGKWTVLIGSTFQCFSYSRSVPCANNEDISWMRRWHMCAKMTTRGYISHSAPHYGPMRQADWEIHSFTWNQPWCPIFHFYLYRIRRNKWVLKVTLYVTLMKDCFSGIYKI